jgi:hypothetical protein
MKVVRSAAHKLAQQQQKSAMPWILVYRIPSFFNCPPIVVLADDPVYP